jgi:amidase
MIEDDDIAWSSATVLLERMERAEITSVALLERLLQRVERLNPALNAVVTLDVERARIRAAEADAARAAGRSWGPLHGLPMTIKDSFETGGLRTTSGAAAMARHVPARHAVAVQRLVDAGAIVFGKSNLPTFAMDVQSFNPVFGVTNNPWDTTRSPGGSSGGAAAALAAGLTPLELGSDIGGSIRSPAHFCGVYGHKPSYGLVPLQGHIPGPPGTLQDTDIAVAGPMARSAEDLMLALDVLAGPGADDAVAWRLQLPPPRHRSLRNFRVAAWIDDPASPVDAEVLQRLRITVEALREAGVQVDESARPAHDLKEGLRVYRSLLYAATSAGLPRAEFERLVELAGSAAAPEQLEYPRGSTLRHRDWLALHELRERQRANWARLFTQHDVLLCPAVISAAIPHDPSEPVHLRRITVNGQPRDYLDQLDWAGLIGAPGLPSTVAPVGRTASGLPVGVQIVGPWLEDRTTITFAGLLAGLIGGFVAPPGY